MKAQFYRFTLGGRRLSWPAKILLSVLGLVATLLVVSFGLLAVVMGAAVFVVMKLLGSLRQALGLSQETHSPFVSAPTAPTTQETAIVREIEVEVLPAERDRSSAQS
jgi:flagellar basal body-associated protein FliL